MTSSEVHTGPSQPSGHYHLLFTTQSAHQQHNAKSWVE